MGARVNSKPRAPDRVVWQGVADLDRERAIAAVLAPSKTRPSSPRWLWAIALVIGVACAVAFVVAVVRGGDGSSSPGAPAPTSGTGFPAGLALGVGIGIAIGWFAARRAQAAPGERHSSRKRP